MLGPAFAIDKTPGLKKTLQPLAISHETFTWSSVLQAEVFVFKLVAIDRLAASSIASCKVTTLSKDRIMPLTPPCRLNPHLTHEVGNDPVEGGTLEAEALLASAQSAEVLAGLRHNVFPKLHSRN